MYKPLYDIIESYQYTESCSPHAHACTYQKNLWPMFLFTSACFRRYLARALSWLCSNFNACMYTAIKEVLSGQLSSLCIPESAAGGSLQVCHSWHDIQQSLLQTLSLAHRESPCLVVWMQPAKKALSWCYLIICEQNFVCDFAKSV